MVKIKLDDKYYLHSDEKQWIITERYDGIKKTGEHYTHYKPKGYLISLSKALGYYYDMRLKVSDATTWEQLVKDSKKIKEHIEKMLKKIEKIRLRIQ